MEDSESDFKLIFFNSEMYLGKTNTFLGEINVLFRTSVFDDKFHFLLYDFNCLFYCVQEFENITKYHIHENPSIEFKDIKTLIEFIIDKLMKTEEENRKISKENNSFVFENFVNIIKVKWRFECDIIYLDNQKNFEVSQSLFVKPLLNTILSIQEFVGDNNNFKLKASNSNLNQHSNLFIGDILPIIGTNLINQNRNFNKNMSMIIKESTINTNVQYLNKLEEKRKEQEKMKLKRKNEDKKGRTDYSKTEKKKEEKVSETSSQMANISNENSMNSEFLNIIKKKGKQGKKMKFI